ncbi:MAG: bifunctional phosphopantothenoylcysteine decarboxylase/phosphopantothenate--cysteine ligase CoaBC [Ruminococcus sp.]|nr:bifunctional phosphopantothenoylcysteine decarboxylase/phosphopantothenate--cysteine ligase CoaBC [Ruminococcus sp.]
MLKGKTVVLAVTGSIAAYKMANVARMLIKLGADVQVLMTRNAEKFINPITFETLTQHRCLIDTFDRNFQYSVEHVALAKAADCILIAPASANVIGKIASGIADDMLTTTVMACPCKKLVAPAMNHNMLHNPIVEDNIRKLASYGYEIIAADRGMLANGDIGDGRLPEESTLVEYVLRAIAYEKDLAGRHVLVTAGATREALDPVRFITNHSSGKMGVAVARAAAMRGAEVTLVCAHTEVALPLFCETVKVVSAEDMFTAVTERAPQQDIIIKAAAVSDYTPVTVADSKIKKKDGELVVEFRRTKDILRHLGEHKREGQLICGFSMETDNVVGNSRRKLESKHCDLICANSLRTEGAGFGVDTNVLTLITPDTTEELPLMSKDEAAHKVLDKLCELAGK